MTTFFKRHLVAAFCVGALLLLSLAAALPALAVWEFFF